MAFNPPPYDFRRAAAVPFAGWVAIYLAIQALRARNVPSK
jgi:hypothetical protein